MKKYLFMCLTSTLLWANAYTQDTKTNNAKKDLIRTDADLKTGNNRDVLTNFFQLALNDLTGPDKRFRFSSNLFALRLKINPNLDIDNQFVKNTFWRNSNFDFDIKIDSNNKFNGSSLGYKIAIVNNRDYALAKNFSTLFKQSQEKYDALFNALSLAATAKFTNANELIAVTTELNQFFKKTDIKFKNLSATTKAFIEANAPDKSIINDNWSFREEVMKNYKKLVDEFKNKLLWTAGVNSSTYSDGYLFSNLDFSTQATANLFNLDKTNNVEFDFKAKLAMLDDSSKIGKDLDRQQFSFEGGFNFVFRNADTKLSWLEFKAAAAYNSILKGSYMNETKEKFTLNGTLRFRLNENIWIPFEFKYDPKAGNVFGFLSVKSNFNWLGLTKSSSN